MGSPPTYTKKFCDLLVITIKDKNESQTIMTLIVQSQSPIILGVYLPETCKETSKNLDIKFLKSIGFFEKLLINK